MAITREQFDALQQDGFRTEAAVQFGFRWTNDDADEYACTEAALVAFAKGCERAGMYQAAQMMRKRADVFGVGTTTYYDLILGARELEDRIAVLDAELKPILEAEAVRSMTAAGYVRAPEGHPSGALWIKLESPTCS